MLYSQVSQSDSQSNFTDKQKLKEFNATKPALQEMLKELIQLRNTREEEDLQDQTPNN